MATITTSFSSVESWKGSKSIASEEQEIPGRKESLWRKQDVSYSLYRLRRR
jgi:hypothetical protein